MAKQKTVSVSEFKARALGYFEEISTTGSSIIVTKRGKPVALVTTPERETTIKATANQLAHTIVEEGDIISPIDESEWGSLRGLSKNGA